jgi:hypothetical protein
MLAVDANVLVRLLARDDIKRGQRRTRAVSRQADAGHQ